MARHAASVAVVHGLVASISLGGSLTTVSTERPEENEATEWTFSLSISTYLAQHARDYANPTFSADHDWLHLEARYNYEALKTGSVWLGYNFSFGDKLKLEAAPMIGGVFGNITGIGPCYNISATYKQVEFFAQGEYFIDAGIRAGNFFYSWSELSYAPVEWFRLGVVVDRTKAFGSSFDVRRGPLVGFRHKNIDFTTYWLGPGSKDGTFIFAVTRDF